MSGSKFHRLLHSCRSASSRPAAHFLSVAVAPPRDADAMEPGLEAPHVPSEAIALLDSVREVVFRNGPKMVPRDSHRPAHYGAIVGMWARSLSMFDACLVLL